MKKLGFGLMRLPQTDPDDWTKIDLEKSKEMIDAYMAAGFSYFDTAYVYGGGSSEKAFGALVADRYPRDSYVITTKAPVFRIKSADEYERIFDEQLSRCRVDCFDYYFLHSIGKSVYGRIREHRAFEFMQRMKAEGKTKHIGFSFHDDAETLDMILTEHPETELVQLQINFVDWDDESIQSRKCYEVCEKHGVKVAVMEPLKGGTLVNMPEEAAAVLKARDPEASLASWGLRFAASLPSVFVVLSGMSTLDQVRENVAVMDDFRPLSADERAVLAETAEVIKSRTAVPCTACHYCTEGCPKRIAIPEYFALYNNQCNFELRAGLMRVFENLAAAHGRPSDCIECGQCERHCPQHIKIIDNLKLVSGVFEKKK